MTRRTYREARAALERHPFRSDLERREFEQLLTQREARTSAQVRASAQDAINELKAKVEEVEGRFKARDAEAEALAQEMESGHLPSKEAGRRVDKLRRELERLDPAIETLIEQHAEAQARHDDPLGYRDRMYARFPALSPPEWPW